MKRIKRNALLLLISVDLYLNFGNYSRAVVTFEKFLQLFFFIWSPDMHLTEHAMRDSFLEWNNLIFNYVLFLYLLVQKPIKFIYSEKATHFCEISTLNLSYIVTVKSMVEISQNFVAFSEYMNFNYSFHSLD